MNLRQLEIFVAVAETGNFSRGAEVVCLTQSTVSQHIAALEAEIGTILFDRTGKGAFLTSGGELFMQHARRVLAERDTLLQAMTGFQGLAQVRLTIGASNIPANYLIPPLLPQLKKQHPGIMLTMLTGDSREILERLGAAEIELAVVGNRFDQKSVDFLRITSDPLVLVVGSGHRWSDRQKISLEELSQEPLVVREIGSGSGRSLEQALRQSGYDTDDLLIAARLGSNEAVLQAVATGYGCTFVSKLCVHCRFKCSELHQVDVEGLIVDRQIWLARAKDRNASPAAEVFTELLLNRFPRS